MASPWARAVRLPVSLRIAPFALLLLLSARTASAIEERMWFSAGPSIVFSGVTGASLGSRQKRSSVRNRSTSPSETWLQIPSRPAPP